VRRRRRRSLEFVLELELELELVLERSDNVPWIRATATCRMWTVVACMASVLRLGVG